MTEKSPLYEMSAESGALFQEIDFPRKPELASAPAETGNQPDLSTPGQKWLIASSYGNPASEYANTIHGAGLFDLSQRGKIELSGPEAALFLHNLSTNDIKSLPIGGGCEALLATKNAKIVARICVYHIQGYGNRDVIWIDTDPGQSEMILKYLDRFLISEQVEFADRTRDFVHLHLAGPKATEILEKAIRDSVPPLEDHQHMIRTFGANCTANIRRHSPLGISGYDILCLKDRAPNIWSDLINAGASPAGLETWETLRLEAGTPLGGIDFSETTFAPELNRISQSISYNKGCYLGQEPIVMARDRGQINRRLMGLVLSESIAPAGSRLYQGEKEVGWVTSSGLSPRLGRPVALGYVRRGVWDPNTVVEVDMAGHRQQATIVDLPLVRS